MLPTDRTISVGDPYLNYRYGVGLCLFNKQGDVLLGKKLLGQKRWHLPQGGADLNETPSQTFHREAKEELNLASVLPLAHVPETLIYSFKNHYAFAGQCHFWIAGFVPFPQEINVNNPPAGVPPEFSETKWVSIETLSSYGPQRKYGVYFKIAQCFSALAQGLRALNTQGNLETETLVQTLFQQQDVQNAVASGIIGRGVLTDFPKVSPDNKYLRRVLRAPSDPELHS